MLLIIHSKLTSSQLGIPFVCVMLLLFHSKNITKPWYGQLTFSYHVVMFVPVMLLLICSELTFSYVVIPFVCVMLLLFHSKHITQGCRTRDRSRDHLQPVSVLVSVSNPRGLGLGLGLEPSWSRSRLIWSRDQQTDRTWNVGSNFHAHKLLQQLKFCFFAHPASLHCPLAIWLLVFGIYWCITHSLLSVDHSRLSLCLALGFPSLNVVSGCWRSGSMPTTYFVGPKACIVVCVRCTRLADVGEWLSCESAVLLWLLAVESEFRNK